MQVCCGRRQRPTILEEIKAKYPECAPENMLGKIYTAGYTACL
jgi:hypothetical protein